MELMETWDCNQRIIETILGQKISDTKAIVDKVLRNDLLK